MILLPILVMAITYVKSQNSYFKLPAKKASVFTVPGKRAAIFSFTRCPVRLKALSEGTEVAGMDRYCLASTEIHGY